jgi:hypothetical protein
VPVQTGTTTDEPFTAYVAACRSADVLEETRALAGKLDRPGIEDTAPECRQVSALLAIADGYRQLAETMAGTAAAQVLRPPTPRDEDNSDPRARR